MQTGEAQREGSYGDRALIVEPGGAEFTPLTEQHGTPIQLLWSEQRARAQHAHPSPQVGCLLIVGFVPSRIASAGDLTFEAGFVITALVYVSWRTISGEHSRDRTALP